MVEGIALLRPEDTPDWLPKLGFNDGVVVVVGDVLWECRSFGDDGGIASEPGLHRHVHDCGVVRVVFAIHCSSPLKRLRASRTGVRPLLALRGDRLVAVGAENDCALVGVTKAGKVTHCPMDEPGEGSVSSSISLSATSSAIRSRMYKSTEDVFQDMFNEMKDESWGCKPPPPPSGSTSVTCAGPLPKRASLQRHKAVNLGYPEDYHPNHVGGRVRGVFQPVALLPYPSLGGSGGGIYEGNGCGQRGTDSDGSGASDRSNTRNSPQQPLAYDWLQKELEC
ncbi:hypothetical protein BD309DRAFT_983278 [Dichomitus squalens]|uniref:Uncharacterized protein n=1 Tax=Dichomitus squalens TaxID=114155 RepID=A0A4Q9PF22_9APHY|nr:hypothetical protein BD309DRAFT_983278 [Dichomitus squalens]TBU53378.1 hypothetical protein BD310DRAFT_909549 [Dichomitus squalens]